MIYLVIIYLIIAIAIAFWGKHRTIGFFNSLVISLILTPFAGVLAVANSSKLILYHIVQYNCPERGYSFSESHKTCPMCEKEGKHILLNPNIVPTT